MLSSPPPASVRPFGLNTRTFAGAVPSAKIVGVAGCAVLHSRMRPSASAEASARLSGLNARATTMLAMGQHDWGGAWLADVPQACATVVAGGGERAAVGAERQRSDALGMAKQLLRRCGGGAGLAQTPQQHRLIIAGGGERATIGAEGQGGDWFVYGHTAACRQLLPARCRALSRRLIDAGCLSGRPPRSPAAARCGACSLAS